MLNSKSAILSLASSYIQTIEHSCCEVFMQQEAPRNGRNQRLTAAIEAADAMAVSQCDVSGL